MKKKIDGWSRLTTSINFGNKNHNHTNNYVNTLLSNGLLPLITLPTRITQTSATIIDHISTSHKSDRYVTGVLISSLSDHLPIFYIRDGNHNNLPTNNVKSRQINSKTIPKFHDLLKSKSFETVTNETGCTLSPKFGH